MNNKTAFLSLAILAGIAHIAFPADSDSREKYIRSHYAKFEYRIPMRDGARLFTSIYVPYDRSRSYPFLITRTPYSVSPYGPDKYNSALATNEEMEQEGYIFVFQDVRGCFMSEGTFVNMRPHNPLKKTNQDIDESSDTYDTIDWLIRNIPNNNGAAGLWGTSYPGFYSSAGMIDSHPALKAVSPQAPIADWFWDDMHRNGAFNLQMSVLFFSSFGIQRDSLITEWPEGIDIASHDAYQFFLDLGPLHNVNRDYFKQEIPFWNEVTRHPDYDDFWQARNILPHLKNIKAAVMIVGGWFDTEDLYGPLKTYQTVEKQNPGIVNTLVMGPWQHGGWNWTNGDSLGSESFGWDTSEGFQKECVSRFFNRYLKGNMEGVKQAEAQVFETGANRWRAFDAWPPRQRQTRDLYLCSGRRLAFEPQYTGSDSAGQFISDPAKPVPYTMDISKYWSYKYMTEDQRFAGRRPDVLVYTSEVLKENVTFVGPTRVCLYVSTTGSDADWIVKIVDVHPRDDRKEGDLQRLVRAEAFRGRFRESFSNPQPFAPGQITEIEFELLDVLHTFMKGHRIMIQIQSSWFPFIDRNPQRYVENIFEATAEDFITATHRVYHSSAYPSHIEVGVLAE